MNKPAAVITGAGQGIGEGVATAFAKAGHPLLLIDRIADPLEATAARLREHGVTIVTALLDVTDRAGIEAAYADARAALGPLKVVVANAGISKMVPFAQMTAGEWQEMIDVNMTGVFHTVQAALPDMLAAQWGRIITISSHAGQAGAPNQVHYAGSKGGVIGMTKAMARELGSQGITANTIPPSLVDTPLMRQAVAAGIFPLDHVVPMIPIPRPGLPEEIGQAAAFLASDEASYITGQELGVNGGMYM